MLIVHSHFASSANGNLGSRDSEKLENAMQVKIFHFLQFHNDIEGLEKQMNEWLELHRHITVLHRDIHTQSGVNVLKEPYTAYTVMVYYR